MSDIDETFNRLKYPVIYYWEDLDNRGGVWYCARYPDGHIEQMVYYPWLVEDAETQKCRLVLIDNKD